MESGGGSEFVGTQNGRHKQWAGRSMYDCKRYVLCDILHCMKQRITISIDPKVSVRAKQLAHIRRTSVSGLVEKFLERTPLLRKEGQKPFALRWAGKFSTAKGASSDTRMWALKKRFNLK